MVARKANDQHALAVLQRVGRHGRERFGVDQTNEVGGRGENFAVHRRAQVLVLEIDFRMAAFVFADALKHDLAEVEAAAGLAQHVGDLALEQAETAGVVEEVFLRRHILGAVLDAADRTAELLAARDNAAHAELAHLRSRHDILGRHHAAAACGAAGAANVLDPLVVDGLHKAHVALLVNEEHGACRHAANGERNHLNFGKRATHAVDVDHGKAQARCRGNGQHGIHAASLDGHDGRDFLAVVGTHHIDELGELVGTHALLGENRRGAHACHGHDDIVVGKLVDIDKRHLAAFLHGANGEQLANIGVAAAARAQKRCAQSDVFDIGNADLTHGSPPSKTRRNAPR